MSASSNPQRVKDLVHKFGWDAIVRIAALGIQYLAEAQIFFVDSGNSDALDADDGVHGLTVGQPLATWDYAVGLCTDSEHSLIILLPGHNESLSTTTVDLDVIGVRTIGIGHGSLTPRVDFDGTAASIDVGANDVSFENIKLLPSTGSVLIGVDVESGVTGFKMKDVEFMIGEDGSGADEFVKAVELKSGNHDCIFENVKILAHASAAEATHGINIAAASNRLTFKNVIVDGPYATGGIVEAAAGVNHIVEDCSIDTTGTNYSFHGSSTFAKYTRNVDAGVDSEESEPLIEVTRGSGNYPTGITNESIFAYIMGKGATASSSTFNNTTDSLEAIADAIAAISAPTDVTDAVPDTPTAKSLQDILSKLDGANTYDNTTDSLEAIADSLILAIGSPAAGSALDILKKLYYGADGTGAYPATVANDSTLAKLMSKSDPAASSSFDNTTDSLEAISDAVAAITNSVTTAVSQTPTARSLQDILEKDGTGSFDDATDSLEAIADRLIDANITKLTAVADGGSQVYPDSVVQESVMAYIMSKSANPINTSYNNTTDSLEAISDALAAGTGCTVAIEADKLDHLVAAADSDDPADDSIIAKLATKAATANWSDFDNTTDSLQAIRDYIAGTTALDAINLDHLALTTTGVAADGELDTHITAGSILGHLMAKTADPSDYNASEDSLQAIADSITTGTTFGAGINLDHLMLTSTGVAADGELDTHITALSVLGHIMATDADPSSYNASTDSLMSIAASITAGTTFGAGINLDHLALTTTGVAADGELDTHITAGSILGHIMAADADPSSYNASSDSLQAIGTDVDAIITDLTYQEQCVPKVATSTDDDLFDVTGQVLITSLIGVVTTQIGAAQNRIKVVLDADNSYDFDFTTEVDTNGDAVGVRYVFSAANPAVLTPLENGAAGSGNPQYPWFCNAGVIEQAKNAGDGGTTGAITWFCTYKPLSSDGAVAAAA